MHLQNLGNNQTQISYKDGTQVFFSYNTPVAARTPDYEYYKTATSKNTLETKADIMEI